MHDFRDFQIKWSKIRNAICIDLVCRKKETKKKDHQSAYTLMKGVPDIFVTRNAGANWWSLQIKV